MYDKAELMGKVLSNTYDDKYKNTGVLYKSKPKSSLKSDEEIVAELNADTSAPIVGSAIKENKTAGEGNDIKEISEDLTLPEYDDLRFDSDMEGAIASLANSLNVSKRDMRYIFAIENGGRAYATNKGKTAAGIIQFFADNSRASWEDRYKTIDGKRYYLKDIANMSAMQQVPLALKYFREQGVKPGSNFYDLYASVFYPASRGKKDDWVLGSEKASRKKDPLKGSRLTRALNRIAKQNKHYDLNYDKESGRNSITNKEFKMGAKNAISTYYKGWKRMQKKKRNGGILYNKLNK